MFTVLKEGEKRVYLITAALLTAALAKVKMDPKQNLSFATGTDNANSIGVEQVPGEKDGELRLYVTAREKGYAAVTTVVSQSGDGRVLAVIGQQYFVADPESAAALETMPVAMNLADAEFVPPVVVPDAAGSETTTANTAAAASKSEAVKK